ncbi:LTA synthase family protein [uncultured Clostridium sp.]|jgi:phosphoglycerol transferase MdoB-like AlkP superfamily enzyme|uniref:LTA synthase family protein n=1 Tax=uncultured Clostridium sp. TaxID=59620 RepID=UPI0026103B2D|nr:LTA synthase family protein [uncultured Clostridium sp.]
MWGKIKSKKMFYIVSWLLISLIMTVIVELMTRENIESFKEFLATRLPLFLLNYAMVLVLMLPMIIFRKTISAMIIPIVILLGFALAGKILNDKRGVPFTGADIYSIEYGIDMVFKYFSKGVLIVSVLGGIALVVGYIYLCIKEKPKSIFKNWQKAIIACLAIITLVGVYASNVKAKAISNQLWNINYSYKRNGFLFSFVDSFTSLKMKKPVGYNKKVIDEIKNGDVAVLGGNSKSPENIILIQLESFVDPYNIEGIDLKENPIPAITKVKEQSIASGKLGVPTYGAGTVRTEFEVLTGYNIDFMGTGEVPNNSILKMKAVESLAQILRLEGYESTMIHNYVGNFYHRDMVYANYGFDTFVSKEYMSMLKYNEKYPEDICNMPIIDELIKRDEKQFIFNVSVESHGPYKAVEGQKSYLKDSELSESEVLEFDNLLNRINKLDFYVGKLVKYINDVDEDTMIVFYSDHLPSVSVFNQNKLVSEDEKYSTEYFVWTNYETKKLENEDLESYEMSTKLLDIADIEGGIIPRFHRENKISNDYMDKFKYLQYDQLYGDNYFKSNYKSSDLKLGLNDVIIKEIIQSGDDILIKGENFTSSSRVIIAKEEHNIKYNNDKEIVVENTTLKSGTYKVIQKGMNGKFLSESNIINMK